MIGQSFWEDLSIDSFEKSVEIETMAHALVDYWGKDLTESDLLKLKAYTDSHSNPVEVAFASSALEYYMTKDYKPDFIHAEMQGNSTIKHWWQFWKR